MSFWRHLSPRAAVQDFATEWRQPTPYRWRFMALSVALTVSIMLVFLPASQRIAPKPPKITWITTFADGRTEAEIIASNLENQKRQERLAKEAAEREEARKQLYRELGRATGLDVDAMEADLIAKEKAEQARKATASPAAKPAPSGSAPATAGETAGTSNSAAAPARAD